MSFDAHTNLAYAFVATAPSPATSGTSLIVTASYGATLGTPPFNMTVWASGVAPVTSNAEIVRVTAISTDTLTIIRAQEGTAARTIVIGDQIAVSQTAKTFTDIENAMDQNLATISNINAKSIATTTLYTPPSGKTAIITGAIVRCTAASAITNGPTVSVGMTSSAYSDIFAATALNALTGTTSVYGFSLTGMSVSIAGGTAIKANLSAAATGTSQTISIDLIGYLITTGT